MILLGLGLSPFVRKVMIVAAEKNIPLENRPLGPTSDDPDFLACSPFRKIPALLDGDFSLADSTAIVSYLESRFPQPAMLPAEARARAKAIWFEEVADTVLYPVSFKCFFNRVVAPKFLNQPGDLAAADAAQATQLPPVYAYLESVAPAAGFLAGDSFSVGDAAITSILINLMHANAPVEAAKYPRLAAYFARMLARPSVAQRIAADKAMLG